jgi:hypothetical protein
MDCFEHYDVRFIAKTERKEYLCPKADCQGDVVWLDELIAPAIIVLNKKGYTTKYCCSGHWYENYSYMYIYFNDWVLLPEKLPDGFVKDKGDKITIRNTNDNFKNYSVEEKFKFVTESNLRLLEWVNALPDCYEREGD